MHRIYDIMERIGKPRNSALSFVIDKVYEFDTIKDVRYVYHELLGIVFQLFSDQLISKAEMNMMIELFQEFCTKRINEIKVNKQANKKQQHKFWN